MKFIRCNCYLFLLLLFSSLAEAQVSGAFTVYTTSHPAGACSNMSALRYNYVDATFWGCSGSTWTQVSGGGGGGGSLVLTSGSGAPSANCAAPSTSNLAVYTDTGTGDLWYCYATNLWKRLLSTTGSGPYVVTGTTGTAPSTPASGTVSCYFNSTSNTQVCLSSAGQATVMVQGASATAGQFVTNIDSAGVQHFGSPAFTYSQGQTGSITMTGSDVPIWTGVTVPALATGACYSISVINDDVTANPTIKLKVDSTVIQTLGILGGSSFNQITNIRYCNSVGVQNAQTINFLFKGYQANNNGGGWTQDTNGVAAQVTTPTAVDWSTGHTITIVANSGSGAITGNSLAISQ